jgi:hypothetical protein
MSNFENHRNLTKLLTVPRIESLISYQLLMRSELSTHLCQGYECSDIDTSHSYVQTKKELEPWGSKVVKDSSLSMTLFRSPNRTGPFGNISIRTRSRIMQSTRTVMALG